MKKTLYDTYTEILKEELIPATGCTEPIAIAYAGALARRALASLPDKVLLTVSGNIIKNVKSVIVPNTANRKGLKTAVAAGICCGNADKKLEVLSDVCEKDLTELDDFLARTDIFIDESTAKCPFDIQVTLYKDTDTSYVRIIGTHTNVVEVKHNDKFLVKEEYCDEAVSAKANRKELNIENIIAFANETDMAEIKPLFDRQMEYNINIASRGLAGGYGAEIGKILLTSYGNSIQNRAKAWAAAGSDARMNGCEMPVVINSGSGNQGITASVPVIIYAKELNVPKDMLYRALIISNLVTIHLKTGIGSLSAYCGATSAGVGAGAGICYLYGGGYKEIAHTIVNAIAINSGMICDGAKSSCAAKIASAVEAGILGMQMYMHNSQFYSGDGIIAKDVENTIQAVSDIAREGMRETDSKIISIMMKN